jgi:hypothetical protein
MQIPKEKRKRNVSAIPMSYSNLPTSAPYLPLFPIITIPKKKTVSKEKRIK